MTCPVFNSTPACKWNIPDKERDIPNKCKPSDVLSSDFNRAVFTSANPGCCNHNAIDHLTSDNCCCTAYYYASSKSIQIDRRNCFIALVSFYALALCYLLYDLYHTWTAKKQKHQNFAEFIKSRKLLLIFISILSMISGIICAVSHYEAFSCFGGQSPGCDGGPSPQAYSWLAAFIGLDPVSSIGIIASKIMMLQSNLRTVQSGLDKAPDGPSSRILVFVDAILIICCIAWFIMTMIAVRYLNDFSDDIGQILSPGQRDIRNALESLLDSDKLKSIGKSFIAAGIASVLATISSFLYIHHTAFHMSRYLKSLQTMSDQSKHDDENGDVELSSLSRFKRFAASAKNNPVVRMVRTMNKNLSRLKLSVLCICLSFFTRAALYIVFAVGFMDESSQNNRGCPGLDKSLGSNITLYFLCDGEYVPAPKMNTFFWYEFNGA